MKLAILFLLHWKQGFTHKSLKKRKQDEDRKNIARCRKNCKTIRFFILRLKCIVLKKNIINVSLLFSVKPSKTISFHQVIQWPSLTYSAHFWKKLYSNLLLKQEDPKSLARWRTNCSEICCRNIKQIVACCPWAGEPGSLLRRDIFLIRAPSFRPTPFRPRHFLPIHFVQSY